MRYDGVRPAVFLRRPNRFLAEVSLSGRTETVHVKNTGRCRELLVPGAAVWLAPGTAPGRRTAWDLIAAEKASAAGPRLINLDSQVVNGVAAEWIAAGGAFPSASIRREVTRGDSRFDFLLTGPSGRGVFLEVKGVTLERGGTAFFPDAPTERGARHLRGLIRCREAGFGAAVLFVIQMKGVSALRPNDGTDPAFGEALRAAAAAGVSVLAVDCAVAPDRIEADAPVPVLL